MPQPIVSETELDAITDQFVNKANQKSLTPLSPPSGIRGAIISGEERIANKIGDRQDALTTGLDAYTRLGDSQSPLEALGRVGTANLNIAGGLYQRVEAGLAGYARGMVSPKNVMDPLEPLKNLKEGVTGEKLHEYGDVLRGIGYPEEVAAISGLGAAALTDPTRLAISGTRKIAQLVTMNSGKKVVGAGARGAFEVLQSKNPVMVNAAFEDKFRGITKANMRNDAAIEPAKALVATVKNDLHKPASEYWDTLAKASGEEAVDVRIPIKIVGELQSLKEAAIATQADTDGITKALAAIGKLNKKGQFVGLKDNIKLKDILTASRELSSGKASAIDIKGVEIISDAFKGTPYESVMQAGKDLWRRFRLGLQAQESIVGKSRITKELGISPKNPSNILTYFSDKNQTVARAFEDLESIYKQAGLDPLTIQAFKVDAMRKAYAHELSSMSPGLKALVVLSTLGLSVGKFSRPNIGTSIGIVGVAAGTPRLAASIARALMNTPKDKSMLHVLEKGGKLAGSAAIIADEALTRELTGRNESKLDALNE